MTVGMKERRRKQSDKPLDRVVGASSRLRPGAKGIPATKIVAHDAAVFLERGVACLLYES